MYSIIHGTLTWITGSLTCVCDLFACVLLLLYTGDLNLLSHLHGFCREFAQNLTLEKLEGTHLANNGHPSVRTPRSIVHHQLFYRSYLPVTEAVHSILLFRNSTHHLIFNRVIRRHTCKVFRMEFFRVSGWASCEHSMAALMWAQGPNLFICVARSSATVLLALRLQLSTKHRATCARKRRVLCSVKLLTLWQAQNVYHQWVPQNVYHQWVPQNESLLFCLNTSSCGPARTLLSSESKDMNRLLRNILIT